MALKFGKSCLANPQFSQMFPLNKEINTNTRHREKYKVNFANCFRLQNSSIPQIQRLLCQDAKMKET